MIELNNITKTYSTGRAEVRALRNISLRINQGEFVAIMGASGSGKSTLLHLLGFLDKPDSGSYLLWGKDITELGDDELALLRNRLIGFVFQQFHLLPRINALQNAELPLIYAGKGHLKEKAMEKINEVGLAERASHWPNELSGGEQQRVAIARSLANEPLAILADEPTGNLDSKSSEEIISILEALNQEGKTIVMVTHEKEIAQHARRIIQMRDGEIISDERTGNPGTAEPEDSEKPGSQGPLAHPAFNKRLSRQNPGASPESRKVSVNDILSESHSGVGKAEFIDHLRQAIDAVVSHKMRSILSMLGILIGVSAVIAMVALGEGAKQSIMESLSSLGSNLLVVMPGSHRMFGVALETGAVTRFTLEDADAMTSLPQISKVSPSVRGRAQLVYGNKNWNTSILGTGVNYAPMRAYIPTAGRFFTEEELTSRQKLAVIGTTIVRELFENANPVGQTMKINRIAFRVIGILPQKGSDPMHDRDDTVVVPVTTAMYRLLGKDYVDSIDVEVKDPGLMEEAQESLRKLVTKRHHLGGEKTDSFEIRNMAEIQETVESTTKTMSTLLGAISAISLIVGGIGIMNIMLVSVTERTREIGLRKAIGARRIDVMTQFLIEAVVMSFIGGIVGILLGSGAAFAMAKISGWAVRVTVFSIAISVSFSVAIGVGFGLWPARKASGLNPIEALRYE